MIFKNYVRTRLCSLKKYKSWFVLLFWTLLSCGSNENDETGSFDKGSGTLYERVSPKTTGVVFKNIILETETMNFFTWKYLYNGGGVALGDINNDGWVDIYLTSTLYSSKLYLNKRQSGF